MFASNLRASFCFLNTDALPSLLTEAGKYDGESVLSGSHGVLLGGASSFKSANGSSRALRFSSDVYVGAVLKANDPPPKAVAFGCTQAAVSVCFIHHFE